MIDLFRKNDITNALILIPYVLVIRLYSLVYPSAYALKSGDGFLNEQFFNHLVPNPLVQSFAAIILVYIQANMINLLVNRSRLMTQQSALPGLFYILFAGFLVDFQKLTPALIGMTFFLMAIFNVFQIYKKNAVTGNIFNSALWTSLASLFFFPYLILAVPVFIEIAVLKSFKIKERFQFLIGLGVLFWILATALFYFESLSGMPYSELNLGGSFHRLGGVGLSQILLLGGVGIAVIWGLLNYYNYMKKKGIGVRKKIGFFYWLLAGTFLCFAIFGFLDADFLFILCLPVSLFIGMNFLHIKNGSLAELLHMFIVLSLFFVQFGDLLFQG